MKKYLVLFAGILLCLFIVGAPYAVAQDEEDENTFMLEEVTVTAQKRAENQQKVPIAMEVLAGEDLTAMGKINVDDILKDVSNAWIQDTPTGMRVSIRGITDDSGESMGSGQVTGGATVAINVDGAYNNSRSAGTNLFDVERVEVLMGPQSTLYGSNAPGGIVNIVTASPKTDKFSASFSQEVASYDTYNTQLMLNAPAIKDKLAFRLAGSLNKSGSYVNPGVTSTDTKSARLKTLWNVYDKLTVTVTGSYSEAINGGGRASGVVLFDKEDGDWYQQTTLGGPGGQTIWENIGPVDDPWTWDETAQTTGTDDATTEGLSAEINWETPYANISFLPSWSEMSQDGSHSRVVTKTSGPPGPDQESYEVTQEYESGRGNTQEGAELRLTNTNDFELFTWILGATYYKSEQSSYTYYTWTSDGVSVADNTMDTTQEKKAVYGNIVYPVWFNDKLRLTFGYRQSWDESFSMAPAPGSTELARSGAPKYSKPDIKYGFEYDAADNVMVWGSYSSGYRSGASMAMPDADGNYPKNEENKTFSLGAKSRWLDNRLQVNTTAFYYDYKNKKCTGFKAAYDLTEYDFGYDAIYPYYRTGGPGGGGYTPYLGADGQYPTMDPENPDEVWVFDLNDPNSQGTGDFTSLGLDLQTTLLITSKDKLNFSISYLDAEWSSLSFHYYWSDIFPDADFKGVTPNNSPKWSASASYDHTFTLGSFGVLTPRLSMQYKGDYTLISDPTFEDPANIGYQEAWTKWDLYATYNPAGGKWSLNAYVKNITDYAVKTSYMSFAGSYQLQLAPPRTYGATFSIKF